MAALRKTLARRFASLLRPSTAPAPASRPSPPRRSSFLQKRPFFQPALPPDRSAMPFGGDRIAERIRCLCPDRIRLDGLLPPLPPPPKPIAVTEGESEAEEEKSVSLEEVRKVVRASQVAAARARLVATGESCVPYTDFVRICCEASNGEQGLEIARSLDKSGIVIVLGNVVFLRPEEVAKAIENMIPSSLSHHHYDQCREELRKMEETKAEIDQRAANQVRKELQCGLGFMLAGTAALMRVTFWELSWDVMEPICFYLTSVYFMARYAFFLRSYKEPSFKGYFASRFAAKQKRLMESQNFDLSRFNELSQSFLRPLPPPLLPHLDFTSPSYCHCHVKSPSLIGSSQ
ncbi:unnamed protein product [Musa acuminata subsp. malaccensis]|uniref:(wild Malaysian banana) hypothetical protein n=1 Tax=Musa acuminata subsp. malaccensis TaxID=214687 RepID=A0A804J3H0_MUSAM|nr:PREDICTED: calcium uniporter protein 3, mitochondrial-like [Musa acuminata subsp. malaccensis]CAG1838239.1 unnamed protein product [Musa acuminata subsp. malaccensis]